MSVSMPRGLKTIGFVLALGLSVAGPVAGSRAGRDRPGKELRVCADPNNLPFSNRAGEGFENRIANIVARAMGRRVVYTWWPQRRGFMRQTLRAGACDVVMGVPASFEQAQPTQPYYRSSYVFVSRRDRHLALSSLDDPRLAHMRVGIQMTGNDYDNPPPAQALAARHLTDNVRGFMVYGDYTTPAPQQDVINAVVDGRVDVAIVWGPVAGYFARRASTPLDIAIISPHSTKPLPFSFSIAMGVRRDDRALREALNAVISAHQREIRAVLREYAVPLVRES